MEKYGNLLMVVGMAGGFSQWLTDHEPAIQAAFYILSTVVLLAGFGFKLYDRFKK